MSDEAMEAARKQLALDQELTNKSREDYAARMKGKPTPTQEENDLTAHGARIAEHEHDGSDPDPHQVKSKNMEAKKPAGSGYQTRQSAPAQQRSTTSSSS
jgi:hypothetical protein